MAGRQESLWIFAMKVNLLMTKQMAPFPFKYWAEFDCHFGRVSMFKYNTAYSVGTHISVARTRMWNYLLQVLIEADSERRENLVRAVSVSESVTKDRHWSLVLSVCYLIVREQDC